MECAANSDKGRSVFAYGLGQRDGTRREPSERPTVIGIVSRTRFEFAAAAD